MLISTKHEGQQWYSDHDPRQAMIRRTIERNIQEKMYFRLGATKINAYDGVDDTTEAILRTLRITRLQYSLAALRRTICL